MPDEPGKFIHFPPSEVLSLPNPRKGWQGGPLAEIRLAFTPVGWLFALDAHTSTAGMGGPLGYFERPRFAPKGFISQVAARDAAIAQLRHWAQGVLKHNGGRDTQATLVARWCNQLAAPPVPRQLDLFDGL